MCVDPSPPRVDSLAIHTLLLAVPVVPRVGAFHTHTHTHTRCAMAEGAFSFEPPAGSYIKKLEAQNLDFSGNIIIGFVYCLVRIDLLN